MYTLKLLKFITLILLTYLLWYFLLSYCYKSIFKWRRPLLYEGRTGWPAGRPVRLTSVIVNATSAGQLFTVLFSLVQTGQIKYVHHTSQLISLVQTEPKQFLMLTPPLSSRIRDFFIQLNVFILLYLTSSFSCCWNSRIWYNYVQRQRGQITLLNLL